MKNNKYYTSKFKTKCTKINYFNADKYIYHIKTSLRLSSTQTLNSSSIRGMRSPSSHKVWPRRDSGARDLSKRKILCSRRKPRSRTCTHTHAHTHTHTSPRGQALLCTARHREVFSIFLPRTHACRSFCLAM